MTEHYYTEKPTTEHDERIILYEKFDRQFTLKTDAGVFSKGRVDIGTDLLIDTVNLPATCSILDLACGYGPVGIALASTLKSGEVVFVDINKRAVNLTIENIEKNRNLISPNVKLSVMQGDGLQSIDSKFEYILLNPPIRAGKETVYKLFRDAYHHLKDKGELWIVIQKKQGAPSAIKELEEYFSEVEIMNKSKGYFIIKNMK